MKRTKAREMVQRKGVLDMTPGPASSPSDRARSHRQRATSSREQRRGSAKQGATVGTQAIVPLRGKKPERRAGGVFQKMLSSAESAR